jgi:hypothetical protein
MRHAFGLSIPGTVSEACDPARMALLIYDMQVGIVRQIPEGEKIVRACVRLRDAARAGGFRVFYTRHMSLPVAASGVAQLRTAMSWQRVDDPAELRSSFPQGSAQFQLVPELTPGPDEVVFDKITMSAFAATPLDFALRDCGIAPTPWRASPWRSASSRPSGTASIWVICRSSSPTRAVPGIGRRPKDRSPQCNSRVAHS